MTAPDHSIIESSLRSVASRLDAIEPSAMSEFDEYCEVGEYGLALDLLCYLIDEQGCALDAQATADFAAIKSMMRR